MTLEWKHRAQAFGFALFVLVVLAVAAAGKGSDSAEGPLRALPHPCSERI